jgi:hypothetical protein
VAGRVASSDKVEASSARNDRLAKTSSSLRRVSRVSSGG